MSVGDVVRGHVTDKSPRELSVQVTSFIGTHKHRELSDIGVKVCIAPTCTEDSLAFLPRACMRSRGKVIGRVRLSSSLLIPLKSPVSAF